MADRGLVLVEKQADGGAQSAAVDVVVRSAKVETPVIPTS